MKMHQHKAALSWGLPGEIWRQESPKAGTQCGIVRRLGPVASDHAAEPAALYVDSTA